MATRYDTMTAQQRSTYSKVLLSRLLPNMPMHGQGVNASIPQRGGTTIEWRYLAPFAKATTPLDELDPPSDIAMVWSKVTATTAIYGAWTKITRLAATQSIDPQVTAAVLAFGENAGQTIHTVLINVLAGGTNVRYADGVAGRSSVAAANVYDAAEARRARRLLTRGNAKGYSDGYHALIHPDVMESLVGDTTVMTLAQYSGGVSKNNGVNLLTGSVMEFNGFKYMESTDAPVFVGAGASGIDVYGTLHFGPNWFGEVDLEAGPIGTLNEETNKLSGVDPIVIPHDTNQKADPLNQYGVVGWKVEGYAAKILQQERGLRIESSAAA